MNDSITLSDSDNDDSVNDKKKLRSEAIKMKTDEINENIEIKRFATRDVSKKEKTYEDILKLMNNISNSIKGRKNKEISLRESLKNEDYDYLKSIIVKKQSKIDYEKTFGDIYELRDNYEEINRLILV